MKNRVKITFNAPVILSIVGISFIVTLMNYITGGVSNQLFFMTYHSALLSPLTWLRAFTHIYSSKTLAAVVVITAVMTSLINYIFFPEIALCGASGVAFAFILLSSFTSFKKGEIPLTFILVAVFFIGQQIVEGITVNDNISNMAHIIGGIVGGISGYQLNLKEKA